MNRDNVALKTECPYCGSAPDYWCVTSSGKTASLLHEARTRPVWDVWRDGFEEGLAEAAHGILDLLARHGHRGGAAAVVRGWAKAWGVELSG